MYRGDDILKIYDQDLNNIGRATREEVHTQGLLHQVAHVWMFQPKEDDTYIMIQKRSLDRELYPGKFRQHILILMKAMKKPSLTVRNTTAD